MGSSKPPSVACLVPLLTGWLDCRCVRCSASQPASQTTDIAADSVNPEAAVAAAAAAAAAAVVSALSHVACHDDLVARSLC